ncbi:MAG: SPOR domain-containing protein [Anaeromyxobacter sp.]
MRKILAVAIKCKHCGERLDLPHRKRLPSLSPEQRKKLVLAAAVVLVAAALGGLGWLVYARVPETKFWVSVHKDVEWHRDWQDARVRNDRTRVGDIYRELSAAHPDDGDLEYLALRALPDGEKKLEELDEAAKRFDKNAWVLYGLAEAEEQAGDPAEANDRRLKAIELFGERPPEIVLGETAVGFARSDDTDQLKALYTRHRARVLASRSLSLHMAKAAYLRGDFDSMVRWEEHAETLGSKETVFRTIKQSAESIGLRPNLPGTFAGPGMIIRIVEYTAKPRDDGTELVLRVNIRNPSWADDFHFWSRNAVIVPASGGKIESSDLWSTDIPPGKDIEVGLPFFIPGGVTVEQFVLDTGLVQLLPRRSPIIIKMDLKPDPTFKVEDPIGPDWTPPPAAPPPLAEPAASSATPPTAQADPSPEPAPVAPQDPPPSPTVPSAVAPPSPEHVSQGPSFHVQVGAYQNEEEAQMTAHGLDGRVVAADVPGKGRWYRVWVGSFATRAEAEAKRAELEEERRGPFLVGKDEEGR